VQGFVTATMRGDVRLAEGIKPELQCECAFSNTQGEAGQIRTASIRGSWVDDVIRVDKFEVASDEAVISGRGCVGPDDALDLNLDAHGLNLTTLCRWAKLQHNISGTADVTIIATGTVSQPVGQASVNVINPIIENTKFDNLRLRLSTGKLTLPTQQINIDELTLVLGQKEITASGFVPVNWQPLSISENGNLSLKLAFDNASLDLLAGITRSVVKNGTGGTLTGSMLINVPVGGGKLKTPSMQGDLTWTGGTIQFSRLDTTFQNIDMHCVFNGDVLTIEKCTGTSAKGGAFEVGGNVKFAELGPSLDLLVRTNSLGLSEKNLSNAYGENIRCKLDSKLKLTGNWRKPIIVGDVAVKDGTVDLTGKAEKIKGKRNQSVDPTFSVAVNVAKTFELRSSRIKTPIGGNLNITGSLSKPLVEGQADLTGGTIIFPIHVFRILPGSNMKLRVHPDEPASVILDLRAKARLTALTGLGRRKRYTVIME
ncbi:MAG: translocation/assembly module TamB domain-containing protein, partial [Armatimonadota bacterium]|nr:translocation/assembly module TamB domain-containing protein [Armatimonadota bacterium]